MTKRDFFILLIKVVGLFILLSNIFSTIPGMIPYFAMMQGWQIIISSLIVVVLVVGLFILLVQKGDWLVDKLKLDKGFDDDRIELGNPNKTRLIQLTVLFIGGYLLVENVPAAILELFYIFQATINKFEFNFFTGGNSNAHLILNLAAVLIGYLLLTNSSHLAKWLIQKSNNKEEAN